MTSIRCILLPAGYEATPREIRVDTSNEVDEFQRYVGGYFKQIARLHNIVFFANEALNNDDRQKRDVDVNSFMVQKYGLFAFGDVVVVQIAKCDSVDLDASYTPESFTS